ncbi:hypothetical protein EJ06DRAFT_495219 [Trichodelitschia bisporula]|uniref:BCAS2 family protein n=1 Tax=Trichodelitschia bisporula TaxID=703511 RepID=A0A6G1HTY0_9PEZI|nr:hypothetical protein EJ06DRAFT_495219 [Trichodelitschia bisporula]
MALNLESTDFLSHIDPPLQPATRDSLIALVHAELPLDYTTTPHPSLPEAYVPKFSPLIKAEHERLASGAPKPADAGIDLARYEALDAPPTRPDSDEKDPETIAAWRETLKRAYTSSTYVSGRVANLSLLEAYGRNAWLIGNSQLEQVLKDLEKELVDTRKGVDAMEEERRARQEDVRAEMNGLEEAWRTGIRGVVEVEVATEDLRAKVLEKRREAAVG